MFSPCNRAVVSFVALLAAPALAQQRALRVCSDPNNLPFSNEAGEGFENRIAKLIARDLNSSLEYTWWPQRKSFLKSTLDEHRCDLVMGIPAASDEVLTTRPYYNSTYVFVSRADRHLSVSSLSDQRLADLRIGIHVVGDDYAPPGHALARRGLSGNLVGFSLFGAAGEQNPPAKLIDAVAVGSVDIAVAWGPMAGYFAKRSQERLDIAPVSPSMFMGVPFTYQIAMAVRKDDEPLRRQVDAALVRQCAAVQKILADYGLPQPEEDKPQCDASHSLRSALQQ